MAEAAAAWAEAPIASDPATSPVRPAATAVPSVQVPAEATTALPLDLPAAADPPASAAAAAVAVAVVAAAVVAGVGSEKT